METVKTPNNLEVTFNPLDVKLNFIDVTLETIPVSLDNTLFDGLKLTSFEELGGLV